MSKNILYIGNKLAKQGRSVTSIETLGNLLSDEGFNLKFTSSKHNEFLRMLDMLYTIFKYRKWAKYIVIDTYSTNAFWYAFFCGLLAKHLSIEYIPILRGGNLPIRMQQNPKLCKQLFGNAYQNVAPSGYLLQAFQQKGYSNLVHIPNSIEIKKYTFKQRENIQPKLLYVRALAHIYNPMLALEVVKTLQKKYPHVELSMVGPFKDDSIHQCKAYAEAHQLPVRFTGKMEKEEWIAYAKNFDIFINTTNVDNTPVSLIEAMALGLPVVTTNVGGISYLVNQDEAILVPPKDVVAMEKAILALLQQPSKVAQLSFNARKKAESFDWHNVKGKWKELLQ